QPVNAAGMRIDPPPSVPIWVLPMPGTTAATAPPGEAPRGFRVSPGFRGTPGDGLSVAAFPPDPGSVVFPMINAALPPNRANPGASCVTGASDVSFEPKRAGMPATSTLSLMPTGMPSISPLGAPALQRASASPAPLRAASRSTQQ